MKDSPSRSDLMLDMLADEVARRLEQRARRGPVQQPAPARPAPAPAAPAPTPTPAAPSGAPVASPVQLAAAPEAPAAPGPSHAAALMARLAVGVLLVVVLINIPFGERGVAMARSLPTSASLVIVNGLVVKEESSPEFWVYRDEAFHWITSLDAFEHLGYQWKDVHVVEDGFLTQFEEGKPLYVLLKCTSSPHIYRLEGSRKRWVVDISTFTAEGHVWEDVKMVQCSYLRALPDGESIPPGRGLPQNALP